MLKWIHIIDRLYLKLKTSITLLIHYIRQCFTIPCIIQNFAKLILKNSGYNIYIIGHENYACTTH
jgi:hypothetical protein